MGLFIFLFVLIALLNIFFPKASWYMSYGWKIKGDVEPSDAYLFMTRVGGVFVLIMGLIFWFGVVH